MTQTPPRATTPAEIRENLFFDPSRVTDPQLVALLLGKGTRRKSSDKPPKSWSCVEIGEQLFKQAGGRLSDLVTAIRRDGIALQEYGIGKKLGARLIATMELAYRWRRGFRKGGKAEIRSGVDMDLEQLIFERQGKLSDGELLVPLIGRAGNDTGRLLEFFKSPQALVESLKFDTFTAKRKDSRARMTLPEADVELKLAEFGRLLAGLELVRRHRVQAMVESRKLSTGASGLSLRDLVTLLDTERRLDLPLRGTLIEILRSHPDLARAFGNLDTLAAEAGAESYEEAVEVHQMFEELRQRKEWSDPAEVVGPQVRFGKLLSVAEAKIARASRPPNRVLEVKELLEAAQRTAIEQPVGSFVDALLELGITDEGAREAFEEARRLYFLRKREGWAAT